VQKQVLGQVPLHIIDNAPSLYYTIRDRPFRQIILSPIFRQAGDKPVLPHRFSIVFIVLLFEEGRGRLAWRCDIFYNARKMKKAV